MKRYLKNKSFLTGAILAFIMLGMLVVSLFWLPYDPEEMYLAPKLSLPSISHLMGTDHVMSEAGLSYLGLGVAPPKPSLGLMLSDAQQTLLMAPWNIAMPAIVITLLVMSFNLIGDGIQEVTEQ